MSVAAGYQKEEFDALGVEFDERNQLADQALEAFRAAWTGEPVFAQTRHWRASGNSLFEAPPPRQPPLWGGGNSTIAMERAVRWCDGWAPAHTPGDRAASVHTAKIATIADLERRLVKLQSLAEQYERLEPLDVCFSEPQPEWLSHQDPAAIEHIEALEAAGVTWLAFRVHGVRSRGQFVDKLQALGELLGPFRPSEP